MQSTNTDSLLQRYYTQPAAIEPLSFTILERLLPPLAFSEAQLPVVKRIVHTTGDPSIAPLVSFHPAAMEAGLAALRAGATVFTDVKMVAAGINRALLARWGGSVRCPMAELAVAEEGNDEGLTRTARAMLATESGLDGSIVVIGNAPTALLAVLDLVDAGRARPALIMGMPVGFVAAAESKQELMAREIPWICVQGYRGGSTVAVAAMNALLLVAARDGHGGAGERPQAGERAHGGAGKGEKESGEVEKTPRGVGTNTAILLIGHGSRAREVGEGMNRVAELVARTGNFSIVEVGHMQLCRPSLAEAVATCVDRGATRILAIPYFLHPGIHVQQDLPTLMAELQARHPAVPIVLGPHLGYHPRLAEVVMDRIAECEG